MNVLYVPFAWLEQAASSRVSIIYDIEFVDHFIGSVSCFCDTCQVSDQQSIIEFLNQQTKKKIDMCELLLSKHKHKHEEQRENIEVCLVCVRLRSPVWMLCYRS